MLYSRRADSRRFRVEVDRSHVLRCLLARIAGLYKGSVRVRQSREVSVLFSVVLYILCVN